ncbi:MAG: DUF5666 domain-containing protein [Acidobacteriota bacterium]|nr:DUF5666 domain-containing protein [Acidobacteriota bacterium]
MHRKLAVLALVLFASFTFARTRAASHPDLHPDAAMVSGVVTSVNGNIVSIANGLVTIDVSKAQVAGTIAPGALIFATVSATTDANAPLQAKTVAVTHLADATLLGTLERVDTSAKTLTVLGRTIAVDANTSFGGPRVNGLNDLVPNQLVQVQSSNVNGRLVARSVVVIAPVIPDARVIRGTVKSIGADAWTITAEKGDVVVKIDAQTKIAGAPKVGDTVEVLYNVDSANANVALAIVKFERPQVPTLPQLSHIKGTAKEIGATSWIVTREEGGDATVNITSQTKIEPGIVRGDRVDVLAARKDNGALEAVLIVRRR